MDSRHNTRLRLNSKMVELIVRVLMFVPIAIYKYMYVDLELLR